MGFFERLAVKQWMKALTKARTHRDRLTYRMKLLGLGPTKLLHYLEGYLTSPKDPLRKAAVGVLKEVHTLTAKRLLLDRLKKDPADTVRYKSAEALGKFKSDDVIEALIEALSDESDRVRLCACVALQNITGQKLESDEGKQLSFAMSENTIMDHDRLNKAVKFWLKWWQENYDIDSSENISKDSPQDSAIEK